MCGIVGYIGCRPAVSLLIEGLEKLEYRGYDSAGVAVPAPNGDGVIIFKKEGRIETLKECLNGFLPSANLGIGHTRWATHGPPSDANAHPHADCSGQFAVVHNGIIENYLSLKEWLSSHGHVFKSETDTEVLPHLVEHFYRGDLVEAVRRAASRLEGSYALAVISSLEPDKVVAVRQDSPLIIGLGEGENFLASDIPAILKYTRRTIILDDGEIAFIGADRVTVLDRMGHRTGKKIVEVRWEPGQAEKGGYEHFMLKEIHEQPRALRDTLRGRLLPDGSGVKLDEVSLDEQEARRLERAAITACGTAYHAGLVGKYLIEKLARLPVEADIASEFRYRSPVIGPQTLVVVISQSGETADTLAAMREAKRLGAKVVAVTNVVGSSVAREAGDVIYTWAGPEIAVASTKAYTTQLLTMYLLAVYLGRARGGITSAQAAEILAELQQLPAKVQAVLDGAGALQDLAQVLAGRKDIFYIGRGLDYAVALEGSLKLKEISYLHAEAYAAGELKHGTLALIEKGVPVIALVTQESLKDKMLANIQEVKARGAYVIALAMKGDTEVEKAADRVFYIPRTSQLLAPVLAAVPLQLLAYYTAVARGCDVDKPRNLAKSVTVE